MVTVAERRLKRREEPLKRPKIGMVRCRGERCLNLVIPRDDQWVHPIHCPRPIIGASRRVMLERDVVLSATFSPALEPRIEGQRV
jgi:hypothetical protein